MERAFKVLELYEITLGGVLFQEGFPGLSWGILVAKNLEYEKGPYKPKNTEKVHSLKQEGEPGEVVQ